jgi:hypothetical protein
MFADLEAMLEAVAAAMAAARPEAVTLAGRAAPVERDGSGSDALLGMAGADLLSATEPAGPREDAAWAEPAARQMTSPSPSETLPAEADRLFDALFAAGAREVATVPETIRTLLDQLWTSDRAFDFISEGESRAAVPGSVDAMPAEPTEAIAAADPVREDTLFDFSAVEEPPAAETPAPAMPAEDALAPAPVDPVVPEEAPPPEPAHDAHGEAVRKTVIGATRRDAAEADDFARHLRVDDTLFFDIADDVAQFGQQRLIGGNVVYFDDLSSQRGAPEDLLLLSAEMSDKSLLILVTYVASPGLDDWLDVL